MRRALLPVSCSLLLLACGDDAGPTAADGSGTSASTGEASTSSGSAVDESGTTTAPETTSSSSPPPDDEPVLAHGIRLTRLTANQAVQVELVRDGVEVAPADYNTRLISGRTTLLRAYWTLHADFSPREIIGRLVADYPDGTQLVQDFPLVVEGDSGDGGASFQWLLQPDQVVDGTLYRVRLLEADPEAATGEVSDPPPVLPLAGRGTLGIYTAPLEMEVVLVPVEHQFDGQVCTPQISEADVEQLARALEQNNPVQQAILTVREPMPYTDPIGSSGTGFSPVLSALAQQRAIDDPDPWVYYYGFLDPCDGFPPGLLGQAIGIPPLPPTPQMSQQRISTGRWFGSGLEPVALAAETFVHEVGHTQGRYHILCSGGEAGYDPAYPHPNGRIGVWGFGIHDFMLRSPTGGRDYMTYCSNEWVSDFGWELTLDVIAVLTDWSHAAAPPGQGEGVLMGALYDDGSESWWTAPGGLSTELATPGAAIVLDGGLELPAWVYERPDGDHVVQVIAPRPAALGSTSELELVLPSEAAPRRIEAARILDIVGG